MSKVSQLKQELKREEQLREEQVAELHESTQLTDEDREKLEELKEEKKIVIVEEESGTSIEVSLDKYLEGVDNNITVLENNSIKLLSMDIMKNKDKVLSDSKKEILNKLKEVTHIHNDEESLELLSNKLVESFKVNLGLETVTANKVIPILYKKNIDTILEMLPKEFDDYIDHNLVKINHNKAKQQILSTIQLMISVGPELDGLNDYIESQHKMIEIILKLNETNMDFYNMIKDEKSFTEIVKEVLKSSNELNNTYKRYTQNPDAVNNIYNQKIIVNNKLVEAYKRVMSEETDSLYLFKIQEEINRCNDIAQAYRNVLELTKFKHEVESFMQNINIKKKFKKAYDVEKAAAEVVEMVNKAKLSLPFPGFTKETKLKEIMIAYNRYFENVIEYYNRVTTVAIEQGDDKIQPIQYDAKLFGWVILIIMGKLIKKTDRSENPIDKYELHATFDMLCKLGGELFMMDKIHHIIAPIMDELKF